MKRNPVWDKNMDILTEYVDVYSNSVAIVIVDQNQVIVHCNRGFSHLLKLTEEPLGKSITEFLTPETLAGFALEAGRRYQQAKWTFQTRTARYRSLCHIFQSDEYFYIFIDKPLLTDDVFIKKFDLINRELTSMMRELQRKNLMIIEANKALQDKEITQNQAAQIASIGQWIWNFSSNEIILSEYFFQILGMDYDEKIKSWDPFFKRVHPDDQAVLSQALERALSQKKPYDSEFRFFHADGTQHHCRVLGQINWNEEGTPLRMVGIIQDITEQKNYREKIAQLAFSDILTGLPNRRMFYDRLSNILDNFKSHKERIAIVFVDLDGFKKVNDSLGHDVGDQLLQHIAKQLEASVRLGDTVARMGGDEFILILSKADSLDVVADIAERILIACQKPIVVKNQMVAVGASIGISFSPDDGEELDVLIKKADHAMYQSKQNGGKCVSYYKPGNEAVSRQAVRRMQHF